TALTFEVSGRAVPLGHRVTSVSSSGATTVTFRATAVTPVAGTPPTPSTAKACGASRTSAASSPRPTRESTTRVGARGWYDPPAAVFAGGGATAPATFGATVAATTTVATTSTIQRNRRPSPIAGSLCTPSVAWTADVRTPLSADGEADHAAVARPAEED